jgi:hypothetical protein
MDDIDSSVLNASVDTGDCLWKREKVFQIGSDLFWGMDSGDSWSVDYESLVSCHCIEPIVTVRE